MRVINGLRKGLILSLTFNASLIATGAQADELRAGDTGLWGDKTDVTLGLGAAYGPRYLGSENYTSTALPMLRVERGMFFFDLKEGLGLQWQSPSGFSASASIGQDAGRADGDSKYRYGSDKLKGMGEVGSSTVLNLHAAQQLTSWLALRAKAELRTGGEKRGDQYALGFESKLFDGARDKVTWGFDAHAGNARFNQTYFGVTDQQSAKSRFASYKADKGIYAYSSELTWMHAFDEHWSTIAGVELTHYTDQVRHSPIITKDTTAVSYLGVNYAF
ncbi:MipA/OmpV family protein [Pseudomonas sp. R16(2017)]|uniref:MipA/OmpV family protein n=1 Tax=Pseudomonas sp. R16(2017) TaxID=1981704 RepID=UPI000A1FD23A|nr:MipA/OmpV family protein [Pseudomonas sp. R16(2017)]